MRIRFLFLRILIFLLAGTALFSGAGGCTTSEYYANISPPTEDLLGMDVWDVRRRLPAYVGGKDTISALYIQFFNTAYQRNFEFLEQYRITVYTKLDTFEYRVAGKAMWADGITYELKEDITPFMYGIFGNKY